MNKGLLIILVLVGAIILLCYSNLFMTKKEEPIDLVEEKPEVEEEKENYLLVDDEMKPKLEKYETELYVNPEDTPTVENVIGFGNDSMGALL